jgi:hypothetical protein
MTVESTSINDHSVVACSATSGMNKTKEWQAASHDTWASAYF